jgi:hypothetical protein
MTRLPALLVAALVLLASTQCFAKCLGDSCKETNSAPCHPHQKTSSHCSSQSFVADESTAAAHHPPDIAVLHMAVSLAGAPEFSSPSVTWMRSASPPLLVRSITILKI